MKKIAVESDLSNISEYLAAKGYDVFEFQHNLASNEINHADAIVTCGLDQDFLGMHDIQTKAMVINASGLTPQQIEAQIEQRL